MEPSSAPTKGQTHQSFSAGGGQTCTCEERWRSHQERRWSVSPCVCPLNLDLTNKGISQVTSRPTKISSIGQGFWGGLLRCEMLSRNNILCELFRSQATLLCIVDKALVGVRNNLLCQWLPTYSSENTAYPSPQLQKKCIKYTRSSLILSLMLI